MSPSDQGRAVRELFSGDARRYDARQYGAHQRTMIADRQKLVSQIFRGLGLPPRAAVLDVACGPGHFLVEAQSFGARPVGIDNSPDMLRTAATRLGQDARLVMSDAERLPFADRTFDAVNCSGLIEYLPEPRPLLKEIFRVLKPGCPAVVCNTNRLSPSLILEPLVDATRRSETARRAIRALGLPFDEETLKERRFKLTFHTPGEFRKLLEGAGFERPELSFYHLQLVPHPLDRLAPRLATACVTLTDRLLSAGPLRNLAEGLLALARRPA